MRYLLLWFGALVALKAFGGGGWVGNAPITFVAPTSSSFYKQVSDRDFEQRESKNSLLLPSGQSRLNIGVGVDEYLPSREAERMPESRGEQDAAGNGNLSYDYGITDEVMVRNLSALGYSLKAGGGEGHEAAVLVGLVNGFGWSAPTGWNLEPGVSLVHTWRRDKGSRWRFTNNLSAIGQYVTKGVMTDQARQEKWAQALLKLRMGIARQVDENWVVGVASETVVGERMEPVRNQAEGSESEDALTYRRTRVWRPLIANPAMFVSRQLGENAQVDWVLGTSQKALENEESIDSIVSTTVQW